MIQNPKLMLSKEDIDSIKSVFEESEVIGDELKKTLNNNRDRSRKSDIALGELFLFSYTTLSDYSYLFEDEENKGLRNSYRLYVALTNSNFNILKMYENKYGGKIREKSGNKKLKENHKKCYIWEGLNNELLPFLKEIYPLSIVKKEQIRLSIEFQEWHTQIGIIKTPEQKQKAERYMLRIQELKKETGEEDNICDNNCTIDEEIKDSKQNTLDFLR